jgi:transposase
MDLNIAGVSFILVSMLKPFKYVLTANNVSDSQVLEDLLAQIPLDEQIDSVYTDGAYDTKRCRQVIADRQAYAVIPPRKNERYKSSFTRAK